ncbi:MAG: hypothetical protein K8F52_04220 [Candidatus Scalindua rubra]|uniref:Uncharacterized protein n=1 Tax=Candidatus Scalindua brodae TaxID=237368 RepID=A0A0B0EKM2_9BACT|nr:MAG: hypothetical protein SCABRO_00649 [Candidatus Scalindua brodae]MBZ0107853.1 hypothetical protein [Candidatus Scalindua rubra]TWU29181.1 hypothetical protein S225a_25580 [Candidatus Brocadiaceae bacterium S225]
MTKSGGLSITINQFKETGMEQLVWAIIIVVFIIFTALKNRARNRLNINTDRTADADRKTGGEQDRLGRYMEELLGIEIPETKPQIEIKRETQEFLKQQVSPREESEAKEMDDRFTSQLVETQKPPLPEKREINHAQFPWRTLSKKDIPNAIILSEIIGPPISKRKSHRLF